MIVSAPRLALACLLLACGPSAPMNPADASTSDPASTTTTPTSSSSSVTTPDPDPTTSTSSTSEPASTTTPDELTFIIASDVSCLTGPRSARCSLCSPFDQDCPEGQKCTPYADDGGSWNSTICGPVDPNPGQPGEPCTVKDHPNSGFDSCAVGSMCWNVDKDTLIGTCILLCTGSPDMGICPEPLSCAVYNEGNLPLCLPQCDPLAQDCAPEDTCIANPTGVGFICVLDASGDAGQALDPCEYVNACDPGLTCSETTVASECDPEATGCCTPFCDLTLPPNCPGAMQTCQPYFGMDPAPPGYENVGICSLP